MLYWLQDVSGTGYDFDKSVTVTGTVGTAITVSQNNNKLDVMSGDEFRAYIQNLYGTDHDAYRALGTANTD